MAKIVTITNPLTGQPAQVDQLDHTAQQIDDGLNIARGVSNPNLLDNWYFANPVNQRGQTSYTVGNTGPDRWRVWGGSITITDSGITPDATGSILQFFECPIDDLLGRMVCATILWSDGTLTTGSAVAPSAFSGATVEVSVAGICNFGFSRRENVESPYLFVNLSLVGKTAKAAKLELGTTQTLAHQENGVWVLNEIPDYGEQLARCQRYRIPYGKYAQWSAADIQTDYIDFSIYLPVFIRTKPSIEGTSNLKVSGHRDFTYQVAAFNGNNLRIRAMKSAHGLTNAFLEADGDIAFAAEL